MTRFMTRFCMALLVFSVSYGHSPSFKSFMNPVIPGDHPDCTVTRIGNDFYTAGSSFNPTPVIYHSTDLVHWEAIAQPVSASWTNYDDTPGGGCWGGHMVLHNREYWYYFSRANTMYFTKAPDPKGPWSLPVMVKNPATLPYGLGYDNSLFIDDDDKWYLVVKNGKPNNGIVELGDDGQPTGVVYDLKWLNPDPTYPYSWAEGPVMWKYNGYYYYSFARDLGGGQKVMRSRTLTAEASAWEMLGDFFNESDPAKGTSLFASPNHASPAVLLDDNTSWVVHPLYAAGEWKGQGRQGLLNQVRYDARGYPVADYPINQAFTAPCLPSSGIPWMVPKSDFFTSPELHPEWSFLGYTPQNKFSLTERPGWLRLTAKSRAKANTVIKNDGEHNYALITRLDFTPKLTGDEAGLWILRGDEKMFVKLVSSVSAAGQKVIAFSFESTRYEVENTTGDTLWFKLARVNHTISGFVSGDGIDWEEVGQSVDISQIDSYSDFTTFTGTRQGLFVKGTGAAWFDCYIYRDAYTPILAECPANQYGTSRAYNNPSYVLDNIHGNDWALYAGIEFGQADYPRVPDSLMILASCGSSGGRVEVWLDSLDTGRKIAECPISNTGSLRTFKTFTAAVQSVSGRHDLYLKFTGTETGKLFQLRTFSFTAGIDSTSSVQSRPAPASPQEYGLEQNYPNPFKPATTIEFFLPHKGLAALRIFNLRGEQVAVLLEEPLAAGKHRVKWHAGGLASGLYLCRLEAEGRTRTRRLLLLR
jgi:beta-xylosidase